MTTVLILNERERDTIIAALRYWQHHVTNTSPDLSALDEIAENERTGDDAALLAGEIDRLIESRVNAGGIADRCEAIAMARDVLADFGDDEIVSSLDDKLYYGLKEAADEDGQLEAYDMEDDEAEDGEG